MRTEARREPIVLSSEWNPDTLPARCGVRSKPKLSSIAAWSTSLTRSIGCKRRWLSSASKAWSWWEENQTAFEYPGPSVLEAAAQIRAAQLPVSLGGITIPSRAQEAERIRQKKLAGLDYFTSQVLFDSNDIVGLIQRLNGLEARIFLSFAPVSHPRDLEVLRWLGVDLPVHLDRFLLSGEGGGSGESSPAAETSFERSLNLAQRILMDVFDNLPPDPPLIGLNVEHINRRNFSSAVKMLERLGHLYAGLVEARVRASLA